MKKKLLSLTVIFALGINTIVLASSNYSYSGIAPINNIQYQQQPLQPVNNKVLQGNVVMVPAGSTVKAMLTTPLSSQNATNGQTVSLALNSDFNYDGKLIAPAGSTVYGTVIESSKAKHGGINGKLCVRFSQIYTPYGTQIPISAVIKTNDSTGVLLGGTKIDVTKEYAKDLAIGSAGGAISGLVFGALADGNIGKGAALGTAVGAGGGLVKSIWDKGNDVEIPANAIIDIMFTQPITVSTSSYHYEN